MSGNSIAQLNDLRQRTLRGEKLTSAEYLTVLESIRADRTAEALGNLSTKKKPAARSADAPLPDLGKLMSLEIVESENLSDNGGEPSTEE